MTVAATSLDLTQVLVVGVPAWIAAVFAGLAMLRAHKNGREMKTPSGDTIGAVVERTHDLTAVGVASTTGVNGPAVDMARRRLYDGPDPQLQNEPQR